MNFYVFSLRMKNKILRNITNTRVVIMNTRNTLLNVIIFEHLFHLKELGTTIPYSNVFCFYNGQKKLNFASYITRQLTGLQQRSKHQKCFSYPQHFQLIIIKISKCITWFGQEVDFWKRSNSIIKRGYNATGREEMRLHMMIY